MTQIGRYEVLRELGRGGMAVVYQARDPKLDRVVAIKLIQADAFAANIFGHIRERFEREARALARLDHPHIVRILDYGELDDAPYLVMDFLEGATLKDAKKPIPVETAVRILRPIVEALDYVHEQNLLHRDVKPSNIMITKREKPMLTDFGIAKWLDDDEDQMTLTGTGVGVGTPEYMAPEQGLGKKVDHRVDQYALAVVFYELITGRKPFQGETPFATLMKQATEPIPDPRAAVPGLSESVKRFFDRAMAKNPEDRYPNLQEFLLDFDGLALQSRAEKAAKSPISAGIRLQSMPATFSKTGSSVRIDAKDIQAVRDSQANERVEKPNFSIPSTIADSASVEPNGIQAQGNLEKLTPYSDRKGMYGLMTLDGATKYPAEYNYISSFNGGLARFRKDGKNGLINDHGVEILPAQYENITSFESGLAVVKQGGKFGYVNKSGAIVQPPIFQTANLISDGVARVQKDDRWGLIDSFGKTIVEPKYDVILSYQNGLARVKSGEKWGFINKTGAEIVTPRFDSAMDFTKDGYAYVGYNGVYGKVYLNGSFIENNGKTPARDPVSAWIGWLALFFAILSFVLGTIFIQQKGLLGLFLLISGCILTGFAVGIFSNLD